MFDDIIFENLFYRSFVNELNNDEIEREIVI